MKFDYQTICQLAAEMGCRRKDLLVLSDSNDPFYAGRSSRKQSAEWFAGLWERLGCKVGSHPRRIHYLVVSQDPQVLKPDGKPYLNTESDWEFLLSATLGARYLRLIPDGALADHRNDPPIIFAENGGTAAPRVDVYGIQSAGLGFDIPEREVSAPFLSHSSLNVAQPYLMELWIEKSTQNDILVPLASRWGVNLVAGTGEPSEVLARQVVDRAVTDGRPMRLLYVSDFDPGGRSMPVALARKVEFWIRESDLDLDIVIDPIVLTPEQCARYRLPRTPLKETERRAGRFEDRFGEGATELDALEALHPGELRRIVENELFRYIDPTLTGRVREAEWAFNKKVTAVREEVLARYDISDFKTRYADIVKQFREEVEALNDETRELWPVIAKDLSDSAPRFEEGDMPKPRPASPPDAPLFDSRRDYVNQIDHYRAWQGKGGAS